MTSPNLSLLSDNFQEIYIAVHAEETDSASLVPNVFGSRVYYSGAGWGRFWKFFFSSWTSCFGGDLETTKLHQALHKTAKVFAKEKAAIKEVFASYEASLTSQLTGGEHNQGDYLLARYKIHQWNQSTLPFIKLVDKKNNEKLTALFNSVFPQDLEKGKKFPFSHRSATKTTGKYQALLDLEQILESPLPYLILRKLSVGEALAEKEETQLLTFIALLNKKAEDLPLKKLHQALVLLIDHIRAHTFNTKIPTLYAVAIPLIQKKCALFQLADAKHAAWRASLRPGAKVTCNAKEYLLGERIGEEKVVDKRHVYRIQGDEDRVLLIGNNRMIIGIQAEVTKKYGWGCHSPEWFDVDVDGISAVVEYLPYGLMDQQWTSLKSISSKDKRNSQRLVNQIQWFLEHKRTPLNFTTNNIKYNKKGILKCTKIPIQSPSLDFFQLERVISEYSQGNKIVCEYILKESGIYSHRIARFYRDVAKKAIAGDEMRAENLAAESHHQIIQHTIIERAQLLQNEIKETQNQLMNTLLQNYEISNIAIITKAIQKAMKTEYKKDHITSFLSPNFYERVLHTVLYSTNPKKKEK